MIFSLCASLLGFLSKQIHRSKNQLNGYGYLNRLPLSAALTTETYAFVLTTIQNQCLDYGCGSYRGKIKKKNGQFFWEFKNEEEEKLLFCFDEKQYRNALNQY